MMVFRCFKTIVYRCARIFEYMGWCILLGWVGLMFAGTIARYIFRSPFIFQVELVSLALVVFCTFCFAAIFLADEHIRVDLLTRFMPKKVQDVFWLFSEVVFFAFAVLIIYSSFDLISHAIEVGGRMEVSNIATAPFLLCIPVGFGLLSLVLLVDFCERLYALLTGGQK